MTDFANEFRKQKEYKDFSVILHAETGRQRPIMVCGLCEGAELAFLEALLAELPAAGKSLGAVILAPDEKKLRRLADSLASDGLRVFSYLYRDPVLHNIPFSHDFEYEHLRVLSAILDGRFDVILTTPDAAMQYTIPKERLRSGSFLLTADCGITREALVERLEQAGYRRLELVEGPGQYAVRGGIVDLYSPAEGEALRADFFGEELDRICYFDVMSQRQTEACDSGYTVCPCREVLLHGSAREEVKKAVLRCLKTAGDERVREGLSGELAALESCGELFCADKYISLIYPEKVCLFDYLPEAQKVVLEYSAVMTRQKEQDAHTALTLTAMLESGELSPKTADLSKVSADLEGYLLTSKSVITCNFAAALPERQLAGLFTFRTRQTVQYTSGSGGGNFDLLLDDLADYLERDYRVTVLTGNEIERENLQKILCEKGIVPRGSPDVPGVSLTVSTGGVGFELPDSRYALLSLVLQSGVRSRYVRRRHTKNKNLKKILSYADLAEGDFVVHEVHGIGQYLGLSSLTVDGVRKDFIKIKYAGTDMLYLPCGQLEKISKYIGAGAESGNLKLSKMGGSEWGKAKSRAKAAAKDMAKELIALYAERLRRPGFAFAEDDAMMREFEDAFPYVETEGQLAAIEDVKSDMMQKHPMDRILCGDVGYGKTEVALRAAFKAAECGKQTAILVPTTILAMQHYRTMLSRMRGFPVRVDMLSRFRTQKEQALTLRKLRRGETDIVVGTHRLLSGDVEFKDLGLLIVDEEQRFGVSHKEKLKKLSTGVDVLTLSATPIPRTMNMALSGIRDMSLLEEAPDDRLPVQSFVSEYDDLVIAEAVKKELRRGGQIFYLCNRIEKMPRIAAGLAAMVPDARIETANGKMDKELLSDIWQAMVEGEIDILITTTIIETGVDVPNANTLIVEDADKLGLSQLHQIRGRVGRSSRRAYAYFTYPRGKAITEISQKRLEAIRDFTEFGAGFRIAMRDMEIRGAGNLLGADQHGHMETVGYDLYMKLLQEAVLEEKGEKAGEKGVECTVDLGINAYIPESYIANSNQRIDAYRKISLIETKEDSEDVYDELLDRYGDPPREVQSIVEVSLVRALGSRCGMKRIERKGMSVLLYPEKTDLYKLTALAAEGKGRVLLNMGNIPYAALRCRRMEETASDTVAALMRYLSLDAADTGGEKT